MSPLRAIIGLSVATVAVANPVDKVRLQARQNASSPCAQVSAAIAAQNPQPGVSSPTVPAQLAYDCITSVPLNKSAASDLIDNIVPYIRWQSTTTFLKDPPEEYEEKIQPAIDVWGGLEEIQSKVENESYTNEFEFGFNLYELLQQTHDGHFVYVPDVVGSIFNWARPMPLVSVSEDGKELPKPYVYPDILAASFGNASFAPSAIAKINGENADEWLENWSQYGSLQDRDALYNNVFYNLAAVSIGSVSTTIGTFAGSGRGRWVYPGATTELEFENGTTVTYTNFARVLVPFDDITDGQSLYNTYFITPKPTETEPPTPSNTTTATTSATTAAASTPAPGYPPPVYRESHNLIGGYYLEDDYSDIAVLSVPSFVGIDGAQADFQAVAQNFLAAAKAAGKKKLIVDVSANGGGTILLGYDLYKQLFPEGIGHAAADRFRAHESTDLIGQKYSELSADYPRQLVDPAANETLYEIISNVVAYVFNYRSSLDVNDENFSSWEDEYGPVEVHGDNFTNLIRWNLSDVLTPFNSGGVYVHGYGNLTNFTQPFAAEDIVVVSDGYCASTCTIFSELMRQRGGVKYISLGGRAEEGITQAVGGVKGTNNFGWDYIQYLAQLTFLLSDEEEGEFYNTTELGDYWSNLVFDRAATGVTPNVNFRDGYRDGSDYQTPLQFVYEPADCRILYTKEMTYDVPAIWKAVADSAWGETDWCVAGGLNGGYNKRDSKREMTWQDKALSKRMKEWKRSLSVGDYPLDIYTDLSKLEINARGFMAP
ncbi:hypothetical protein K491DRAFT_596330 [Lophiostoma macrostomum CBS 122681]|uniref:Uncharacterized protein n=1 Tax=Lophiostoma macrostomum CBS 122681 TaxID=1314788 RepID=A0A6A6TA74_9PLEO|nr:hypothetical protein K491DRAFT_596330 [Lophiostoma macrostomum CBS 122681]